MYDLIVIGGGPAGYAAAIRAAQEKLSVALVEKNALGGTCLNRGCIPTKALLHAAKSYAKIKDSEHLGIKVDNITFDVHQAYEFKDKIVEKLGSGQGKILKANKIDFYPSTAKLINKNTLEVSEGQIQAKNILIATGSKPATLPIKGIEHTLNSDDILNNPICCKDILIIGGGVIGLEFATMYSDIGSNVIIVEALDRLIPMMDKDLSAGIAMALKKKKVKIHFNSFITKIEKLEDKYKVSYEDPKGKQEIIVEKVVLSTGRLANIDELNLENVGVKVEKGAIVVDNKFRTSISNIYAAGDVIGGVQLAHYAYIQGLSVIESILSLPISHNLNLIPSCVYSDPEIATVGLNESQCEGMNINIGKFMIGASGKGVIGGYRSGFCKVIVDCNTDQILGAQLLMPRATDLISEIALAISSGIKRKDFLRVIHPHPTYAELVYESMEDSKGKCINMLPKTDKQR